MPGLDPWAVSNRPDLRTLSLSLHVIRGLTWCTQFPSHPSPQTRSWLAQRRTESPTLEDRRLGHRNEIGIKGLLPCGSAKTLLPSQSPPTTGQVHCRFIPYPIVTPSQA